MQRAMARRSPCSPWNHLGFVWTSIFWFVLAYSISVTYCKQLDTEQKVSTTCGSNVTLTCNASKSELKDLRVMKFEWQIKDKTLCQYEQNNSSRKIQCKTTNTTSELTLTMTILNIIPADEGVYHCKLHTTGVTGNGQSHIKVEGCLGSSGNSMDKNSAKCSFSKVFPRGEIHWYQGESNLTGASIPKEVQDENGFYTFESEVPTEKGNQSQPYNCSLWMPSLNRYIASQRVESSGIKCQLQWICIILGILMTSLDV